LYDDGLDDGSQDEGAETPDVEPPDPVTLSRSVEALTQSVQALQEANEEQAVRNRILEGLVRQQQQQAPPAPVAPVQEAEPTIEYDEESFTQQWQVNPSKAIAELVKKVALQASKIEADRVRKDTTATIERNEAERTEVQQDRDEALRNYGGYFQNPEFANLAEAEYQKLLHANGGKRPARGMYHACSSAFSQLTLSGKLKLGTTEPASKKVVSLGERRRIQDNLTSGSPTPESVGDDTLVDLSARELAFIKRHAKSLGVTEKQAIEAYKDERKKDPGYGSGR